jgi:DNA polymerase-3 subunit delta
MITKKRTEIEQALKRPSAHLRLFLLYGPDEAGSRALMKRLDAGPDAERVDLTGAELKSDPARLPDEAASISLFGGARYIVVEPVGDEVVPAVEALLEAAGAGNPVVMVAGALKPASKLLKLASADKRVLAFASYPPEARDLPRIVQELGREQGLSIHSALARRIAESAGGNRAVIAQELAKYALYADAGPDRPATLEDEAVDAVGAGLDEGDLSRLVDSVTGGNPAMLRAELLRLASEGIEGIPLIRAVLRRVALLARLRAEVDGGRAVAAVMASSGKAIFWREQEKVSAQLARWPSELLAKSMSRLVEAELQAKASGGLAAVAVDEELFAIARQAARLR